MGFGPSHRVSVAGKTQRGQAFIHPCIMDDLPPGALLELKHTAYLSKDASAAALWSLGENGGSCVGLNPAMQGHAFSTIQRKWDEKKRPAVVETE